MYFLLFIIHSLPQCLLVIGPLFVFKFNCYLLFVLLVLSAPVVFELAREGYKTELNRIIKDIFGSFDDQVSGPKLRV